MGILMLVLMLILAGVLALFGAQNTEPIALHFLWFTVRSLPVSVAILGGAVLGALLSLGVSLPSRVRHRLTVRTLKRQVARHEARLTQLTATATTAIAPDDQRALQRAENERQAEQHDDAASNIRR